MNLETPLRALFVVQGEGRGHLTQSLALGQLLREAGHEVVAVLVGHSRERAIPPSFLETILAPVQTFTSPNFAFDHSFRDIRPIRTVVTNLRRLPEFRRSLRQLLEAIQVYQPDLVVNFYEPLIGVLYRFKRHLPPLVSIGHQYFFLHPAYPFPPELKLERYLLKTYTRLTTPSGALRLALSFYETPDLPNRRLYVVPPLLRPALFQQPLGLTEPFILVYLLNRGYAEDLIRWQQQHPEILLHVFWDNTEQPDGWSPQPGIVFYHLHAERFLEQMVRCRAVVSTAGFETVSEALYLGKPVLVVPVEGHFEQRCNAHDLATLGGGLWSPRFDLDPLLSVLPPPGVPTSPSEVTLRFRAWVAQAPARILPRLFEAAQRPHFSVAPLRVLPITLG
jgi:uncharacterized protein (TIGR00661 family)